MKGLKWNKSSNKGAISIKKTRIKVKDNDDNLKKKKRDEKKRMENKESGYNK